MTSEIYFGNPLRSAMIGMHGHDREYRVTVTEYVTAYAVRTTIDSPASLPEQEAFATLIKARSDQLDARPQKLPLCDVISQDGRPEFLFLALRKPLPFSEYVGLLTREED